MNVINKYSMALIASALLAACSSSTTPDAGDEDSGTGPTDGGTTTVTYTMTTVENAFQTASGALKDAPVEIENAIVVSAYSFLENGVADGTFYIQDTSGTHGIAVYHGKTDMTAFPVVGDIVTVEGKLAYYDGSLQITSSTKYGIALVITVTGSNGMAPATNGALAPAGTPIMIPASEIPGYAYSVQQAGAHLDQVGNVLQFAGPLQVTNQYPCDDVSGTSYCFVSSKADGGTPDPQGFQVGTSPGVNDGLWVYDYDTYYDCMKGLGPDGGSSFPTLTNGVRGVWDRYQDYYGGSMAPIFPILVPMGCADYLGGATDVDGGTIDAGTSTDAGATVTDGGTTSTDGGTDAGTSYPPPG